MKDRRMDAYYYEFTPTGVEQIDKVLGAVACAGEAFHHTGGWSEEVNKCYVYDDHTGNCPVDWIQNAGKEAADEIERLRALVQLTFGLLWEDRANEARRHLSDALTQEQKGKGIAAARADQKYADDAPPFPSPVVKAIEVLEHAAKNYQWFTDDENDHGWIKYSAAAVMLNHWAAGLGKDKSDGND